MKNIVSSISVFCKKHANHFFLGVLLGLLWQWYIRWLLPVITINQHKLFWIFIVFVSIVLCHMAQSLTQVNKYKLVYRTYGHIFTMIEVVLVMNYFLSDYVVF